MKKILSCFTIITLGFASIPWAFAATVNTKSVAVTSLTVTLPSKNKTANLAVEADIIQMQKDGVKVLRELINTYVQKDAKESGNTKWNFDINEGDTKINVEVNVEKYVKILSYLQGKQEFGAKGTIKLNMTGKRTDYNSEPTKDSDGYNVYKKLDMNLSANIQFDGNVKIIGKDLYFTLAEFKKDRTGTDTEVQEFDDGLREIDRYVGKTYKVSMATSGIENPNQAIKQAEAIFQVLETKSLLAVTKSHGNTYLMQPKKSTLQAINLAIGKKKNDSLNNWNNPKSKDAIEVTYQKNPTGGVLRVVSKKNKKNYTMLTSENGAYTLEAKSTESNRRLKTRSDFQMLMKKDFLTLKVADINSYSSSWYDVSWQNNQLSAKAVSQTKSYFNEESKVERFEVRGPLDIWTGNMDLKFIGNSKEYGNLMIQAKPDSRSFKFDFGTDIGMLGSIKIGGEGAAKFEQGIMEIVAPTDFESIDGF